MMSCRGCENEGVSLPLAETITNYEESHMGFLGFGGRSESYLIVVTYEGPGRLRLNGNHLKNKQTKKNAAAHEATVCWQEFGKGGVPRDQGLGPAAGSLKPSEAERLLRELIRLPETRKVLEDLASGRDISGKWLTWGKPSEAEKPTAQRPR